MTWFDVVAFILLGLIAWLESIRGFGRALFDMLGAIIALKLAPVVADPLAENMAALSDKGGNQAFWLAMVFLALVVVIIIVTRLIYQSTLLSLDYLDPIIGGVFGVVIGIITVFFFLSILQYAYGAESEQGRMLVNSFVGQEVLELRSYHTVVTALRNLGD